MLRWSCGRGITSCATPTLNFAFFNWEGKDLIRRGLGVGEQVPHKVQGVVLQQQVRLGTQPDFQKQFHQLKVLQGPQIHRKFHLMVQNYPKKSKKGGKMERKKKCSIF